jgi:gamma-glutamylputrescine oxidase
VTEVAWDALAAAPAPLLHAPADGTRADLVVVGLGASGLAACRHAAERGADVVGLDAHGVAAGAAGRNGGFLLVGGARFHHDAVAAWGHRTAVALHRASVAELERTLTDLEAGAPHALVSREGSLRIAHDDAEARDVAAQLEAMRADGLAVEPYDGPEGTGLLLPRDAACNPVARARHLAAAALRAGARLHAPAEVVELGPHGVTLASGVHVAADRVVVAVDGGLERLLPELAGRVRTTRLQMCATAAEPALRLPRPVYRRWGYDYLQQAPGGEVLIGGGRDLGGDDEWDAPPVPTAAVQDHLDRELARLGVTAPVMHRWAARAAFTDDRLPVLAEVRPSVVVAGAYSGHGNLLGTLAARRAVDAALDGTTPTLLDG